MWQTKDLQRNAEEKKKKKVISLITLNTRAHYVKLNVLTYNLL